MFDLLLDILPKTVAECLDGNVYAQENKICDGSQFWEEVWRKLYYEALKV